RFPIELCEYIRDIIPRHDFSLETVGNPLEIYGVGRLGTKQEGYSYNPRSQKSIEDWSDKWFLFADEGADPVIIDRVDNPYCVQRAAHGMGDWTFEPIADSIAQFLLCSAATHHALTHWGYDVILDDRNGFNLAAEPAKWLFPKMRLWAGSYYEDWCSIFN